ncbi:MAG: bifunctional ADP-heptose synthase, partial [Actinobacteria bacterium]|nr:bifunctional ADP-heptose synthase [Actinomycetota bacterium]
MDELLRLLGSIEGKAVLVLGDLFLDEYLVGRPRRVSREAPVLILEYESRFVVPGGGSNPAGNIAALGARACQVGVIGHDQPGEQLKQVLQEKGVDVDGVVVDAGRPTTTKTRLVAAGFLQFPQQIVRLDKVDRRPISGEVEQAVVSHIDRLAPVVDAILLSDYKSGVLNDSVIGEALKIARKHGKPITVDSQGDLLKFSGFTLVKCNAQEAESFLGRELRTTADYEAALQELRRELKANTVVVTRGADGMSVMSQDGLHHHIPVVNRSEVFDVTGAGDTVIALLTLSLASGGTILQAAHLANFAAGLVVRKLGNATTSQEELAAALRAGSVGAPPDERRVATAKIVPLGELRSIREALREDGKKVVFTNGS